MHNSTKHTLLVFSILITAALSAPWFDMGFYNYFFIKAYTISFAVFIAVLWLVYRDSNQVFEFDLVSISLLALLLLGIISLIYSVNLDFSISKLLLWLIVLFAFILARAINNQPKILNLAVLSLVTSATVIALMGISQHLFVFPVLPGSINPAATFGNKNMAAQPLVFILPLSLYLLHNTQKLYQHYLVTFAIALMLIFIFYTQTRAVWLAVLFEFLVIFALLFFGRFKLNWNPTKAYASFMALLFLLIMINFSSNGFELFWHDINQAVTSALNNYNNVDYSRFHIWSIALDMFNNSPFFGTGLGSFMHNEMVARFHTIGAMDYQRVHNDLLEFLVELGLFGVTLFMFIVFFLIQTTLRCVKNQHKNALFYTLSLIGILASFVNMQFSSPYQNAYPLLLFGLLSGFISQSSPRSIKRTNKQRNV